MSIILTIEPKRIDIDLKYISSKEATISLIPYNIIDGALIKRPIYKFKSEMDRLIDNQTLYHTQHKSLLFSDKKNELNSYFEDIFSKFKSEIENKIGKTDKHLLRISSNPWTLQPHFDCMNNFLFMLYGTKIIYTFSFDNIKISISQERQFIQKTIRMNGEQISKLLLDEYNIHTVKTTIHHGDIFFIPLGTYHIVENDNSTKCTISINLYNYDTFDENVDKRFDSLWGDIKPEN
jgi:hypothetical protein